MMKWPTYTRIETDCTPLCPVNDISQLRDIYRNPHYDHNIYSRLTVKLSTLDEVSELDTALLEITPPKADQRTSTDERMTLSCDKSSRFTIESKVTSFSGGSISSDGLHKIRHATVKGYEKLIQKNRDTGYSSEKMSKIENEGLLEMNVLQKVEKIEDEKHENYEYF